MTGPVTSYNPADTSHLISAVDEIKGTKVYSPAGDDLGHIDDVMIDAATGKVVYGVLQFGGFLGMGSEYHPIPFGKLTYDHSRNGYTTNLTKEELEGAPRYADDWRSNREWQQQSYDYFGVAPYWP